MKKEVMNNTFYLDTKVFILFPLLILIGLILRYGIEFKTAYYIKEKELPFLPIEKVRDINRASIEEIDIVPGIGEKTATKIVNFRNETGAITNMELLLRPFGPLNINQFFIIRCYFDISENS